MPFDLHRADGLRQFVDELRLLMEEPEAPDRTAATVRLWLPEQQASIVGREIEALDVEVRQATAATFPFPLGRRGLRPFFFEELLELGYPLGAPLGGIVPIAPWEGGLELIRAERGGSFIGDFEAVGAALGMLVNLPQTLLMLRALARRLPFRIVRRKQQEEPRPPVAGGFGETPEQIEARRIVSRVRVTSPDGREVTLEQFSPPRDEAA